MLDHPPCDEMGIVLMLAEAAPLMMWALGMTALQGRNNADIATSKICIYLHGDDTLLVDTIESGAQRLLCLAELFFRAFIEEVLLVMCLNV